MNVNRHPSPLLLRLLAGSVLFLFFLQVLALGLSLLQVRLTPWLARGVLALALASALLPLLLHQGWVEFSAALKRIRRAQAPFLAFLAFAGLIYLFLWAAAGIMPDLSYDGNAYHIPTLAMWDVCGYVHWVQTSYLAELINGYPKGSEVVAYLLVKAFGNSVINAPTLLFLPLGVFGIAFLASSLGAESWLSLCAGATFMLIPVNLEQSVTTYVDTAYAACAAGVLAALVALVNDREATWWKACLFGAVAGLAISVKSTGIGLAGLAVLFLIGVWVWKILFPFGWRLPRREKRPPRNDIGLVVIASPAGAKQSAHPWRLPRREERPPRNDKRGKELTIRVLLLLGIAAVMVMGGGFWYIRNLVLAGSPLYPVGMTLLGHRLFPGVSISTAIAADTNTPALLKHLPPLLRVLYTWLQGLQHWPLSLKGYDSRFGGLGFLWLLGCFPGIIVSIFSYPKLAADQKRSLLVLLLLTGLAFLSTPMNWWARYTIWIYALGLPCLALAWTRSVSKTSEVSAQRPRKVIVGVNTSEVSLWTRRIASIWLALCVGLLLFEALYTSVDVAALASPGSLRSSLKNAFQPATWRWPATYLFPDMKGTALETVLTQPGNVAIGPHGGMDFTRYSGLVGQLSQPIGFRRLSFLQEKQDLTQPGALAGIRSVLWDASVPVPAALKADKTVRADGFLVITLP